jgi:hypothetical protein
VEKKKKVVAGESFGGDFFGPGEIINAKAVAAAALSTLISSLVSKKKQTISLGAHNCNNNNHDPICLWWAVSM